MPRPYDTVLEVDGQTIQQVTSDQNNEKFMDNLGLYRRFDSEQS